MPVGDRRSTHTTRSEHTTKGQPSEARAAAQRGACDEAGETKLSKQPATDSCQQLETPSRHQTLPNADPKPYQTPNTHSKNPKNTGDCIGRGGWGPLLGAGGRVRCLVAVPVRLGGALQLLLSSVCYRGGRGARVGALATVDMLLLRIVGLRPSCYRVIMLRCCCGQIMLRNSRSRAAGSAGCELVGGHGGWGDLAALLRLASACLPTGVGHAARGHGCFWWGVLVVVWCVDMGLMGG